MDMRAPDDADPFLLSGPVGRGGANDRADVIKAQTLLANAGYLDLPAPGVPTGWPGSDLASGITRLQKDNGLEADGVMLPLPAGGTGPHGEGETLQYLKDAIGSRFDGYAAASPADVDRFYERHVRQDGDVAAAPLAGIVTLAEQARTGAPAGTKPSVGMKRPSEARIAQNRAVVADLLDDPRVQAFLDTLADRESRGRYNVKHGGTRFDDYSQHPDARTGNAAAGAYQFKPNTWSEVAAQLDLRDFTPAAQDQAAVHLLDNLRPNNTRKPNTIRSAIERLQRGDIEGAIFAAGSRWDAFPRDASGKSLSGAVRQLQPIIDQYHRRLRELQ